MNGKLTAKEPPVTRISRFQSLRSGQYWRSIKHIEGENIEAGTVLLLRSIRWVEDTPHTIVLLPHPSMIDKGLVKEHRFLLKDFLELFEYEPDAGRIREDELRAVQERVQTLQKELQEAQSDPHLLELAIQKDLLVNDNQKNNHQPLTTLSCACSEFTSMATGTLANAFERGLDSEIVSHMKAAAQRELQIAGIKANWLKSKTQLIAETIGEMTPFYKEQAEAALAQTEDVREYVGKLVDGIESLGLYLGEGVEVKKIREGIEAPRELPLTFMQRKLLMDEELSVWVDVDENFDFQSVDRFFDALRAHDELVEQIFPTSRCALVMATTRRYINYASPLINDKLNYENQKVFLLVRNGSNLYCVTSPVESHLGASRLFPSKDEQEAVFKGIDGRHIKFDDISYTDKLDKHEQMALHYKRFLLLVCGLDHRLKLFGNFYEGSPSLEFLSLDFQEKNFRFISDDEDENLLSNQPRIPLDKWISDKNAFLQSGSRVLCYWKDLLNPVTAPGACKVLSSEKYDVRYRPEKKMSVEIAYKDGEHICVGVQVSGHSFTSCSERKFNCKVKLIAREDNEWASIGLPFLCLDNVAPQELSDYIKNRATRVEHLAYIRLFKLALKHLEKELEEESETRQKMMRALEDGNIASKEQRLEIINKSVVAWRASRRGKPLPSVDDMDSDTWDSLLNQMYLVSGQNNKLIQQVQHFISERGLTPLRLTVSGKEKILLYAAPEAEEIDDRFEPHAWVDCLTLERGVKGIREKNRKRVVLPLQSASEVVLHQWSEAENWLDRKTIFRSLAVKQDVLDVCGSLKDRLNAFRKINYVYQFELMFNNWSDARKKAIGKSRWVKNPGIVLPFGVIENKLHGGASYICLTSEITAVLLAYSAPDENCFNMLRDAYIGVYENKEYGCSSFDESFSKLKASIKENSMYGWGIGIVDVPIFKRGNIFYSFDNIRRIGKGRMLNSSDALNDLMKKWYYENESYLAYWFAEDVFGTNKEFKLNEIFE